MAAVAEREGEIEHAHASQNRVATGKVYITRHGERADLADERWVATTTVSTSRSKLIRDLPLLV